MTRLFSVEKTAKDLGVHAQGWGIHRNGHTVSAVAPSGGAPQLSDSYLKEIWSFVRKVIAPVLSIWRSCAVS